MILNNSVLIPVKRYQWIKYRVKFKLLNNQTHVKIHKDFKIQA